jgi:hypothetical protein
MTAKKILQKQGRQTTPVTHLIRIPASLLSIIEEEFLAKLFGVPVEGGANPTRVLLLLQRRQHVHIALGSEIHTVFLRRGRVLRAK